MKKIKNYIKLLLQSKTKLFIWSSSFLLLSIFLLVINKVNDVNNSITTPLENQRYILSGIFLSLWYYTIPLLSDNTKEQILFYVKKTIYYLILSVFVISYWISTAKYKSFSFSFVFDVIFSILLFIVIKYIVSSALDMSKFLLIYIDKIRNLIFGNQKAKPSNIITFIERLTAILVSISGTLGTLLVITNTIKAMIETFN